MYDLITFGSITADLYFKADELTRKGDRYYLAIGGKYFINDFKFFIGGGGANVSIGVKKNRLKTAVCALLGNNNFRKAILHQLTLKGISKKHLLFKQKHDNISIVLLNKDGERTTLKSENLNRAFTFNENKFLQYSKTRSAYFGNLTDIEIKDRFKLIKYLKSKGVSIFLNLGISDIRNRKKEIPSLLKFTDILIQNKYEMAEFLNMDPKKINLKINLKHKLNNFNGKYLIVTDAEDGSYCYDNTNIYYQKAIRPIKIIDTTGAGDGYTAGFIAEFLKTQDIRLSMKKGAYYAAKIIGRIGAN